MTETILRCFRGGGWNSIWYFLQPSFRDWFEPGTDHDSCGFRLVVRVKGE